MGQNRDELCTVNDYLYDVGIQRLLFEERNIASILCEKGRDLKVLNITVLYNILCEKSRAIEFGAFCVKKVLLLT